MRVMAAHGSQAAAMILAQMEAFKAQNPGTGGFVQRFAEMG